MGCKRLLHFVTLVPSLRYGEGGSSNVAVKYSEWVVALDSFIVWTLTGNGLHTWHQLQVGCGAVWYHRGPNGPIGALIGNQYPPRTFKSTKNILTDPFDLFCYPKPAQTVKIDVLLKYCLKSEKAVRIQIHLTDVLARINCISASLRLFRASEVLLDIFEALTESKRSAYSLKLVKRSGG